MNREAKVPAPGRRSYGLNADAVRCQVHGVGGWIALAADAGLEVNPLEGSAKLTAILFLVILVLVAAVLYPTVGERVDNMTNASHEDYVGSDSEAIVAMIPIFYWLAIALVAVGVAVTAIKDAL